MNKNELCQAFGWGAEYLPLCEEIRRNFVDFTQRHIARVNTLASFIGRYFPKHDEDKFDLPYYYLLQWRETEHALDELPGDIDEINRRIDADTWTHILRNPHHPEHWDNRLAPDEPFARKDPKTNIDATGMDEDALSEFVCDCLSMSIMRDKDPDKVFDWFEKSVGLTTDFKMVYLF